MKISSSHVQPFDQFPGKGPTARNKAADIPSFANMSDTATANQAKAISAANAGRKDIPPGLERVQARLQATPVEDLSKGQANALDRINRNIARYMEMQAMATPASEQTVVTPPVTPTAPEATEVATESPVAEVVAPSPAEASNPDPSGAVAVTEPSSNSEPA